MNPLEVIIVTPGETSDGAAVIGSLGALVWMSVTAYYCCTHGWLDATAGRLCIAPVIVLAGVIGFVTTLPLLLLVTFFGLGGLFIGWVFDIPIFASTASLISTVYHWIF